MNTRKSRAQDDCYVPVFSPSPTSKVRREHARVHVDIVRELADYVAAEGLLTGKNLGNRGLGDGGVHAQLRLRYTLRFHQMAKHLGDRGGLDYLPASGRFVLATGSGRRLVRAWRGACGCVTGSARCGTSPPMSLRAPGARPDCWPATRAATAATDRPRGCESSPGSARHPPSAPSSRRRPNPPAAKVPGRGRPGRAALAIVPGASFRWTGRLV
jgi:hypothetical protein